jgi:hypothetical protein
MRAPGIPLAKPPAQEEHMKALSSLVFGGLLLVGASGVAHAGSGYGYVCSLYESPSASIYGNFGGVSVNVYSGPSCTGSYVGGGVFCTTGATSQCSYSSYYRDEPQQMSFIQRVESAMTTNQKVYLYVDGSGNPYNLLFYAQGY